jgi:hypothetical protein
VLHRSMMIIYTLCAERCKIATRRGKKRNVTTNATHVKRPAAVPLTAKEGR